MNKICTKCGVEKPLNDKCFNNRKISKDGFRNECKQCLSDSRRKYRELNSEKVKAQKKLYYEENKYSISEKSKLYYEENKEHIKENMNNYYHENREKVLKYSKAYRKANPELIAYRKSEHYEKHKEHYKSYNKQWYQDNKDKVAEDGKVYRMENKERIAVQKKQYQIDNPHISRRNGQAYIARRNNLKYTLTTNEWNITLSHFDNQCAYCGIGEQDHINLYNEILHQEHIVAVSNGGDYEMGNIIPSCKICNSSKRNNELVEWYSNYKYYDEVNLYKILQWIEDNKQRLSIL